jgi:hypothetical protein
MVLFLDFDGVLHADPCTREKDLLCRLPHFESIIRDYPWVDIVISSAWRETWTLPELQKLFSPDIALRVIDVTPHWRDLSKLLAVIGYERHTEIEAWLRRSGRPRESWVAIDDRAYLFTPLLPNLVLSNPKTGLNAELEKRLREKLDGA